MKLSIVATLYKSASYIDKFCGRASAAARQIVGDDYEIVLVNDGSPDESLRIAVELSKSDPHLVVIDLSRNFGHHKAMMTGLKHSSGEHVFLIDSDLEEEPEWLLEFNETLLKERCDVVYGVQDMRKGGALERWSGHVFYRLFNSLAGISLPKNVVTARLMTRQYVSELLRHEERELMIAGLWIITGFDQRPQKVKKHSKRSTTYTLPHKLSLLVNSITSFSNKPLIGIFYTGIIIFIISGAFMAYLLIHWLYFARPIGGWTSVMASIWLLGGLIISFIGVIGVYLSKVFIETKNRPYTIVKRIYGKNDRCDY